MKQLTKLLSAAALLTAASAAHSIPVGTYQLFDHPAGVNSTPTNPYGLRMDDLGYHFSVNRGTASVMLNWAGGATASVSGTLYNNQTDKIWGVSQTIVGIVPDNVGPVTGFTTLDETVGVLTLTDFGADMALGGGDDLVYNYNPKSNGTASFLFLDDDHRCGAYNPGCGDIVGRGWFQNLIDPSTGQRPSIRGTNDWLVQARLVPTPAPTMALLLAGGLIGLGIRRKMKK